VRWVLPGCCFSDQRAGATSDQNALHRRVFIDLLVRTDSQEEKPARLGLKPGGFPQAGLHLERQYSRVSPKVLAARA
jgi:hypothetical protein